MSALRSLIQGQDVSFDTHQAGAQNVNWKDLHLEKHLHRGGKIRYPMFGNHKPTTKGVSDDVYQSVTNEVRHALKKDTRLTDALAHTIADQLQRFRSNQASEMEAREAARKIAEYFGLKKEFVDSVARYSNIYLKEFVSIHRSVETEDLKEIRLSSKGVVIREARQYYWAKYEPKVQVQSNNL